MAKELHAHGAGVGGHAVHDPARAGDQAVTAFFLHPGQARKELVGHVFAQTFLAESLARDHQGFGADRGFAVGLEVTQLKGGDLGVVDLAHVVVHADHVQPFGIGRDHAPAGQVVERRAPQNRFFAARVHGDVAANARGLGRSRVHRKDKTAALGRIGHTLGHHTGFGVDGRNLVRDARQVDHFDLGHGFELFGVDDRALPSQRNRAARVTRAAAPGHDGQAQIDTAFDQPGHFDLRVRRQHHKGVFHAPVGRIGHMAHAREAVELDVVFGRQAAEGLLHLAAQLGHARETLAELHHGLSGHGQQLTDQGVAGGVHTRGTALLHLTQAVLQGLDQQFTAGRVVQQVVLQIRVALDHPDVAQHFVKHAGRSARAALASQIVEQIPSRLTQQTQHDFTV